MIPVLFQLPVVKLAVMLPPLARLLLPAMDWSMLLRVVYFPLHWDQLAWKVPLWMPLLKYAWPPRNHTRMTRLCPAPLVWLSLKSLLRRTVLLLVLAQFRSPLHVVHATRKQVQLLCNKHVLVKTNVRCLQQMLHTVVILAKAPVNDLL